jgi:hypothetical protein
VLRLPEPMLARAGRIPTGRGWRGLDGVVRKRDRDPYRPGERQWVKVKVKNPATARFAEEREGVGRRAAHV